MGYSDIIFYEHFRDYLTANIRCSFLIVFIKLSVYMRDQMTSVKACFTEYVNEYYIGQIYFRMTATLISEMKL